MTTSAAFALDVLVPSVPDPSVSDPIPDDDVGSAGPVPDEAGRDVRGHGDRVEVWARAIEAGVLAHAAREGRAGWWRRAAADEELAAIEQAGRRARDAMVAANLGLVWFLVRAAGQGTESAADLFQEGCLGLMAAIERYDHRRGIRFSTYAAYWIRAFVTAAAARQSGPVTVPVSRAEQRRAALGTESALAQELGRTPNAAEVASAIGRDRRWTADLLSQGGAWPLDELGDRRLYQLAPVNPAATSADERDGAAWARKLLSGLGAFERRVMELRLGFGDRPPASRPAVARELRVALGQVRRAELRALERLRDRCPEAVFDGVAS